MMFVNRVLRQPALYTRGSAYLFTTKTPPAPSPRIHPTDSSKKSAESSRKSSCPPNTLIEGVNYLKGQAPVLARPDEEYPDWLWTILEPKVYPDDGPGGKAERVQRQKENKQRIKDQNFMKTQ